MGLQKSNARPALHDRSRHEPETRLSGVTQKSLTVQADVGRNLRVISYVISSHQLARFMRASCSTTESTDN